MREVDIKWEVRFLWNCCQLTAAAFHFTQPLSTNVGDGVSVSPTIWQTNHNGQQFVGPTRAIVHVRAVSCSCPARSWRGADAMTAGSTVPVGFLGMFLEERHHLLKTTPFTNDTSCDPRQEIQSRHDAARWRIFTGQSFEPNASAILNLGRVFQISVANASFPIPNSIPRHSDTIFINFCISWIDQ